MNLGTLLSPAAVRLISQIRDSEALTTAVPKALRSHRCVQCEGRLFKSGKMIHSHTLAAKLQHARISHFLVLHTYSFLETHYLLFPSAKFPGWNLIAEQRV